MQNSFPNRLSSDLYAYIDSDAPADELRVGALQRDLEPLPYRDAGKLHLRSLAQPVDLLFEEDVILALRAAAVVRHPDDEDRDRESEEEHEGAHQHIVRASFHQLFLSCAARPCDVVAARPRGPLK